jgi:hypothetical protein
MGIQMIVSIMKIEDYKELVKLVEAAFIAGYNYGEAARGRGELSAPGDALAQWLDDE